MKLTIEIDDETYVNSYLSILSIGLLECLEKKIITYDDSMRLLYLPGILENLEKNMPGLGDAIHLGTKLEDVAEMIPDKLKKSYEQIRDQNEKLISLKNDKKQHVFYNFVFNN